MSDGEQVWTRLDLIVPPLEYEELVALLIRFETCGFQEEAGPERVRLSAFFPGCSPRRLAGQFEAALRRRGLTARATASTLRVDPEEWIRQCRHHFKGFAIGETFYVQPGWEEPVTDYPVRLVLEPGQAFGTGTHESTQLALRLLESTAARAASILDIGTGSGILAMAAARLQPAAFVAALDVDEAACATAVKNCCRNQLLNIRVLAGGPEALRSRWDLVLANLTLAILGDLKEEIARLASGSLIVSGFVTEQQAQVADHFLPLGFEVKRPLRQGGWSSLLLSRRPGGAA